MYRKLVPYDGKRFFGVDQVALHRTAERLLASVPESLPEDDSYDIHQRLVPMLKKAIVGAIELPIMDERELIDGRYIYERREGLLPNLSGDEFQRAYASFSVNARSLPLDPPEVEIVDGQQCAWIDFEEEGDWPDKVKYP